MVVHYLNTPLTVPNMCELSWSHGSWGCLIWTRDGIIQIHTEQPNDMILRNKTRATMIFYRRKFRSQTSDNMDRWKSRGGKSQRGEAKKWEEQRSERVRRKKRQVREKVGKSRFTMFFKWFVAPEGRKVGSLKRQVRSRVVRWEMNNCTPLRREAHLEIETLKTPHVRSTFGSSDVEKMHAIVARSQNAQNTTCSDHFWKLRCRESARLCGAKHVSKSKR